MRVLAIAAFPTRMAATRFRIAQFVAPLAACGIELELAPLLDEGQAARLYDPGRRIAAARDVAQGLVRLGARVARGGYDVVLLQREAAMVGPPLLEALATRHTPLVFDLDDAVWMTEGPTMDRPGSSEGLPPELLGAPSSGWTSDSVSAAGKRGFRRLVKMPWKAGWLARRAAHVIAGSEHLARWARAQGAEVSVLPTVVPAAAWTPLACRTSGALADEARGPTVGWVGTHTTAPQLSLLRGALARLACEGRAFRVRVVGAGAGFELPGVPIEQSPWRQDTELEEFRAIDVGVTPMFSSEWHEGKCGFKQLQLMSVGVPLVTSLVGGARDFVRDGDNALVARDEGDWYGALGRLFDDRELRSRLSRGARRTVEAGLSTEAHVPRLARILEQAARRPRAHGARNHA